MRTGCTRDARSKPPALSFCMVDAPADPQRSAFAELHEEIRHAARERNAVILAHNYERP